MSNLEAQGCACESRLYVELEVVPQARGRGSGVVPRMADLPSGATEQFALWTASCPFRCSCPCLMAAKFGEGRCGSKDDYYDHSERPKRPADPDKREVGEAGLCADLGYEGLGNAWKMNLE